MAQFHTGIVVTDYSSFTIDGDTHMTTHPLSPEPAQVEVPKFYEFIPHILAYLADGVVHANREILQLCGGARQAVRGAAESYLAKR